MTPAEPEVGDAIFRAASKLVWDGSGNPPKLNVLDAGTGCASLKWLLGSKWVGTWTAVTASATMEQDVAKVIANAPSSSPRGRVVQASWDDPMCLEGSSFDVVIADYLLGSVDGFTPYSQDLLFGRLAKRLVPGGLLIVVGLEPIPNSAQAPYDVVPMCARLRDAVFLHAGQRPYREYPLSWVKRSLKANGLLVEEERHFPIVYSAEDLVKELNTARTRLAAVESRIGTEFAQALAKHIDDVEARTRTRVAQQGGRLRFGEDYLVSARAVDTSYGTVGDGKRD